MSELYFSTDLTNERILCISTLTDRGAAAAGDEIDTPLGYFLYEISCDHDPDHISVLARLPSEEAVMRLRELLRME